MDVCVFVNTKAMEDEMRN